MVGFSTPVESARRPGLDQGPAGPAVVVATAAAGRAVVVATATLVEVTGTVVAVVVAEGRVVEGPPSVVVVVTPGSVVDVVVSWNRTVSPRAGRTSCGGRIGARPGASSNTTPTTARPATARPAVATVTRAPVERRYSERRRARSSGGNAARRAARLLNGAAAVRDGGPHQQPPGCERTWRSPARWVSPATMPAALEEGEQCLARVPPHRVQEARCLGRLRCPQELGLAGEQALDARSSHDQAGRLPDQQGAERLSPGISHQPPETDARCGWTARTSPRPAITGIVATKNPVNLRNNSPPPSTTLAAPTRRNTKKTRAKRLPVPLDGTRTGRPTAGRCQADYRSISEPGSRCRQLRLRIWNAAETPAKALALQRFEGQRHDAFSK